MASGRVSKVKGKVLDIPTVPTIGTATAGPVSATVAFTASTKGGPVSTYTALSNPGSVTGSGTSSPVTVSGLTAGTSYTFTVRGNNATGSSEYSSASNSVTPTVSTSYESIATYTVGSGGTADITFSSIPSTYTHLQIRGILKSNRTGSDFSGWAWLKVNGSDGARHHPLSGDGASVSSAAYTPNVGTGYQVSATGSTSAASSMFGACIIDILDYKDANKNKTIRTFSGAETNTTGGIIVQTSYLVNSTSAITSISIGGADSTNLLQYSTLTLYGIKGA
jgi:hypothetical protein